MEPINTNLDELQKKIEAARLELSEETRKAIDSVDWKSAILSIKAKKGYSLEQLSELEVETELLLCGLINPENFPKELEARMKIPQDQVDVLVNEMNELVFKKIRDALMKSETPANKPSEIKPLDTPKENPAEKKIETDIFKSAQIEINPEKTESESSTPTSREDMLSKIENPDLINKPDQAKETNSKTPSISAQKLTGSFQIPTVKTDYTMPSLSKDKTEVVTPVKPRVDPYREIPE